MLGLGGGVCSAAIVVISVVKLLAGNQQTELMINFIHQAVDKYNETNIQENKQ